MSLPDHRPRVAAERRERMRLRLFASTLILVAEKGAAETSIDDVISHAKVARGTFYKYFASPDALVHDLALELANELIRMAEPVVQKLSDPAERVSAGIRVVARLAVIHPPVAGFLVRLGWPETRGPDLLLQYLQRDLAEGIRAGRFQDMPMGLALNIVAGLVLGAAHCMLQPECPADFPELSAAAALRALGMDARTAQRISSQPLAPVDPLPDGLLVATLGLLLGAPGDASPDPGGSAGRP
jgi:AcrR family transcriptional regulator